jgi:tetratricopeptide (TPR) repeat protein
VELFARPETRSSNELAAGWAEQARALEPESALASVCLATTDWRAAQFGWDAIGRTELLARALAHAERAIHSGPRDPDAHYALALIAYSRGETARAEEALRHCIRLSASFAPAYGLLALIRTRRGFAQETRALSDRAFALSPREPLRAVWHLANAWAALALGDFRSALEESQFSMSVNPDFATCYITGAAAAHQSGSHELAQAWIRHLRERTVFHSVTLIRDRLPPATEAAHRRQMDELAGWMLAAGLPQA